MGVYYPVGAYMGRVVSQELGTSSKSGTPQLALTIRVEAELDRVTSEELPLPEGEQKEVWVYLYLTEKAMDMAIKALKVLGYNKTSLKYLDPDQDGFVNFADKAVPLYCKHEEYEGEARERWQISTPREAKPVDPTSLKKLDALFGKGLKELATSNGSEPVKKSSGKDPNAALAEVAAEVQGSDDIPF